MLGLVLEGGGAKGAFHMGAVKALIESGYKFDGVAGTSIGAINGAIIAQGDFQTGYEMWESMDNETLFDIEQIQADKLFENKIDKHVIAYFSEKIKNIIDNKGIDTSKIRTLIESIVDEDKLRESNIDFGMVSVSLKDFKPLEIYKDEIPKGMMIDYIMASANLPVFKLEPIEDKIFIDGGFYDNLPINLLVRKGYKNIIAIRTQAMGITRKVESKDVNITYISPSDNLGSILNFDNDLVLANIKLGYYDAMRVVNNLAGKKYYIKSVDDDLFFKNISFISENTINSVGDILLIPKMEPRRMLFEKIFPALSKILKLNNDSTYQDIVIGTLEYLAEEYNIERFEIYTLREFLFNLKDKQKDYVNKSDDYLDFRKINLSSVFSGEIIIKKIAYEFLVQLEQSEFQ